jgi:Arc/MetJ-type ribon-helix-helix transcriptional regulator
VRAVRKDARTTSSGLRNAPDVWYTYGMKKTTLYLPDELKKQVETVAKAEGSSEADVIRDALSSSLEGRLAPEPRLPLPGFSLKNAKIAERAHELMDGFGE